MLLRPCTPRIALKFARPTVPVRVRAPARGTQAAREGSEFRVYVLTLSNFKGGVGKTHLAAMLAVGLSRAGQRVLLVDMDPQGDCSRWMLGNAYHHGMPGTAEAMLRAGAPRAEELHAVPSTPGLTILPATQTLAGVAVMLPTRTSQETTLRRVLAPLAGQYEAVVVDTQPSKSALALNALTAAHGVLVPFRTDEFSLNALLAADAAVQEVKELLNSNVHLLGQVLFGAAPRTVSMRQMRDALGGTGLLFESFIRRSEPGTQMATRRHTAWDKGEDAGVRADYEAVLAEVLARIEASLAGRAVA